MSVLAIIAIGGLFYTSRQTSVGSAYLGFICALVMWAWHELTFLMGLVTGPRKKPCPPETTGWRRFVYATAIVIHHELALAATAIAVLILTWDAPNQTGTATFMVLWIMRISAKFNVFLGVQNLTTDFIPEHLGYMLSYFKRAPMNPLMPISVLAGSVGVVWLTVQAFEADTLPFRVTAIMLVATTLALAVIEHVFLVVPVPDALLWRWAHSNDCK